jgi:hypothetical protein
MLQLYVPDHNNLNKWLDLINRSDRRLSTHHIGEYFTFLIGKNYLNTKKKCSEGFKKWFEYYQGVKPVHFVPLRSWINQYAKEHDYMIQYYDCDFGYSFTMFTRDEWYVRKG